MEKKYLKRTPVEQALKVPKLFVGSVERIKQKTYVFDEDKKCMVKEQVEYVPAALKIFDEVLVNAVDNMQQNDAKHQMTKLQVKIDKAQGKIEVFNNGQGIEVRKHEDEDIQIPQLIFGEMMTSAN